MIYGNSVQMEKEETVADSEMRRKEHGNKETEERLHQQPDSLSLSLSW